MTNEKGVLQWTLSLYAFRMKKPRIATVIHLFLSLFLSLSLQLTQSLALTL